MDRVLTVRLEANPDPVMDLETSVRAVTVSLIGHTLTSASEVIFEVVKDKRMLVKEVRNGGASARCM